MASSGSFCVLALFICLICGFNLPPTTAYSKWPHPHHYMRQKATQNWLNHGGDLHNRRYANKETKISPKTASKLELKWKFMAGGDISATPAIFNGILYFPSWNGYMYALKASDGSVIWGVKLESIKEIGTPSASFLSLININSTTARATPTVVEEEDLLIFGIYGPAFVVALKRSTGEFVWTTQLETHSAAVITMSGTYYKGGYYIGTSSVEEGSTTIAQCCTFRGSFLKLDATTGKILWKKYMIPDNFNKLGGYSGGAVWGSSPPIDKHRNSIFIATGNLYSVPEHVRQCQEKENNLTKPTHLDTCLDDDIHSESILALDLDSGKIKWYHQLGGYDVWFIACNVINFTSPDCPPGPNPDADFGEAPMMLTMRVNGSKKDAIVAVQKSGFAWSLDRDTGHLIWLTEAGPGGIGGGGTWGAATDKKKIYTNIANSEGKNFTLKPSNKTTNGGGWVAMDAHNGKIIWSAPDPNPTDSSASGPVTIANGVLFAGSTFREGPIYAIDAETGQILWFKNTGATVYGGASVSDGCVFFGHGYKVSIGTHNPIFTAGKTLFAFCVT